MKLLSARFKGLQGIYNKSGIKDIFIDFTKCQHNIIYIIGANGSGKSTLMSVLHPLPDSPQVYIDKELGEKELTYEQDGTVYRILIQYPVYGNGARATTKAFFTQMELSGAVELNANGTVGSFKDILFNKFNLDPNFMALSHISVENRGIVEKTPAERKKYVGFLLDSVAEYNDIYKTLVKRSSSFKSIINSITAKIDSIGDEQKLLMDKSAADARYISLENQKTTLTSQISSAETTIKILDPEGKNQESYKKLFAEYSQVKDTLEFYNHSLNGCKIKSLEDANKLYMELSGQKMRLDTDILSIDESIQDTILLREEESKIIFIKTQKYNSMTSNSNIDQLKKYITEYRKRIFEYENIFKKCGIEPGSITKDEYITAISIFEQIRTSILNIKSYADDSSISIACDMILNGEDAAVALATTQSEYIEVQNHIKDTKELIQYNIGLCDRLDILNNRPSSCKINDCSFIKDALIAQSKEPEKNLNILNNKLDNLISMESQLKIRLEKSNEIMKVYNDIKIVTRSINTNRTIIQKFPIANQFLDTSTFINKVKIGDQFNDIYTMTQYIDSANIFELYINDKKVLLDFEADYKVAKSQEDIILELQKEIEDTTTKLNNIVSTIENKQSEKLEKQKALASIETEISATNRAIDIYTNINNATNKKMELESKLRVISDNIEKISREIDTINKSNSMLNSIIRELEPLKNMKDEINYSLNKLAEYKSELEIYTKKYSTIELLKKYSSPTKGGIQTIFIKLYMDKILNLTNQLLGMLFNGELELLPYIIDENGFKIPVRCKVNNLSVDDVSNCSTSEKSMIAVIMSFALAFHSSQIYNIVRLDEVDGGLDQANRAMFPVILDAICRTLDISQTFIISHSSESDMTNVDIISLTPVSNETLRGNVIFQL